MARVVLDPNVARDEYEWEWVRAGQPLCGFSIRSVGEIDVCLLLGSDVMLLPPYVIDHDRSARPSSTRRGAR